MTHTHIPPEGRADRIGIVASAICGVHCLFGAILAGASGFGVLLREQWLESLLLGSAVVVAVWALVRGFRRHHQRLPFLLFAAALPWIIVARSLGGAHPWPEGLASMTAALFFIAAHLANLRALSRCAHHHGSHAH